MKICVVGTGYVGIVTGACLADFGMDVICVDKDESKIAALERGEIPIYEPGLDSVVEKNVAAGRLEFTTELEPSIEASDVIFIAVGTPPKEDGSSDLTYVRQVAESIANHLNGYKVIVNKSTVPIGTGRMVEQIIVDGAGDDAEFAVVSNPEFLREGSAIDDFMNPDRVVIGSRDERATEVMLDIYSPLRVANVPFVVTNVESSELIKYASNAFLATKISFINEVAELCEHLGADVEVVAHGMGLDHRIGNKFLHPGPGYGGSCFPKDTQAIVHIAHEQDLRFRIVESVLEVNERVQQRMVEKICAAMGGVEGKTIGLLGLAFKPETDDIRESPAITIAGELHKRGARVKAFDPAAMDLTREVLPDLEYCTDSYEVAEGAHALVLLTEWNQFRKLGVRRLKEKLAEPLIIDLRNIYEPEQMEEAGFRYVSIGRPKSAYSRKRGY